MTALQCCVNFCWKVGESAFCIHTLPPSWTSLPPGPPSSPPGHHRALSWASCALEQASTAAAAAKSHQSCPTLCDPVDGSPPGSPVPGILQARTLAWTAISFSISFSKVKSESEVAQSCPTLSNPMDCSPPGSSTHGIFQARVLAWGASAFSEASTSYFTHGSEYMSIPISQSVSCSPSLPHMSTHPFPVSVSLIEWFGH